MEIFTFEQGTEEWFAIRRGIPTASRFNDVMASGKGGGVSLTRQKYMRVLAAEVITGFCEESYTNAAMERGKVMEAEARAAYELITGNTAVQVGFVKADGTGCSPDFLVGDKGLGEIKTKTPHLMVEILEERKVPTEHKAQIQGQLWICERDWCDFVAYWPGLPVFIERVPRDEDYIKKLAEGVAAFNAELQALIERLRRM
jgi:hypothetical protein